MIRPLFVVLALVLSTNLTTVSDFRDRSFAEQYWLRIKESGLLARAV